MLTHPSAYALNQYLTTGCPYMCDITPYGIIGHTENTRLMDIVDDMSREDWWVRPWTTTPMQATTATIHAINVTDTGMCLDTVPFAETPFFSFIIFPPPFV